MNLVDESIPIECDSPRSVKSAIVINNNKLISDKGKVKSEDRISFGIRQKPWNNLNYDPFQNNAPWEHHVSMPKLKHKLTFQSKVINCKNTSLNAHDSVEILKRLKNYRSNLVKQPRLEDDLVPIAISNGSRKSDPARLSLDLSAKIEVIEDN